MNSLEFSSVPVLDVEVNVARRRAVEFAQQHYHAGSGPDSVHQARGEVLPVLIT